MIFFPIFCRLLSVIICLASIRCFAIGTEVDAAFGSTTSIQTNSEFRSFSFLGSYKTNSSSTDDTWSFGAVTSIVDGQVSESNFSFQHFQISEQIKKGPFEFIIAPGLVNRTIDSRNNSQIFESYLGFNSDFEATGIQFEVGSKSLGEDLQSSYSIRENLGSLYYRIAIQRKITETVKLSLLTKTLYLSDTNQRSDSDLALMYGISTTWPWIWVGFGTEFMSNSKTSQSYWSPRQFYSFGPRIDVAAPIFGKLSFALGLNLNKFQDIDFGGGQGFYSNSKLIYGDVGKLRYEFGIEAIQSEQSGNIWRSQAMSLGLSCLF